MHKISRCVRDSNILVEAVSCDSILESFLWPPFSALFASIFFCNSNFRNNMLHSFVYERLCQKPGFEAFLTAALFFWLEELYFSIIDLYGMLMNFKSIS